jgi:hypothetical protein
MRDVGPKEAIQSGFSFDAGSGKTLISTAVSGLRRALTLADAFTDHFSSPVRARLLLRSLRDETAAGLA